MENGSSNRGYNMKKPLLTLALAAIYLAAFAQGKVTFGNDANHLIVMGWGAAHWRGAPWLEGLPAPQIGNQYDVMSLLTAQLFAGTSPDSLRLQYTMTPAGLAGLADGRLKNVAVTMDGIGSGVTAYFQILIWETSRGSYTNTQGCMCGYSARTPVFSGTPGLFTPTPLTSMASWSPGPILLDVIIPEPSTFALLSLGGGSLLLIWRRK